MPVPGLIAGLPELPQRPKQERDADKTCKFISPRQRRSRSELQVPPSRPGLQPIGASGQRLAPSGGAQHEGPLERPRPASTDIHYKLSAHRRVEVPSGPSVTTVIASLQRRLRRLLDLSFEHKIEADTFHEEHLHLTAQTKTLQDEAEEFERDQKARDEAVAKFDLVASLLADLDLERI